MKASPLTFLDLKFIKVVVEADFAFKGKVADFDFDGTMLAWSINHGKKDGTDAWWVAVGFTATNENAEVLCPYLIEVQAIGAFQISTDVEEKNRERIVYENGAALVYGAIRDMVSSITSRSIPGHVMLPTPTFIGTFEEFVANKEKAPQ